MRMFVRGLDADQWDITNIYTFSVHALFGIDPADEMLVFIIICLKLLFKLTWTVIVLARILNFVMEIIGWNVYFI